MRNPSLVIDTNVLLVIIPTKSKYHWLFDAFKQGKVTFLLSSEMALEYEEKLSQRYQLFLTNQLLDILLLKKNAQRIYPSFAWNLITADPDDNKFVDCAVAGNADFLITNDAHFEAVKRVLFPKVNIVSIEEFKELFDKLFLPSPL